MLSIKECLGARATLTSHQTHRLYSLTGKQQHMAPLQLWKGISPTPSSGGTQPAKPRPRVQPGARTPQEELQQTLSAGGRGGRGRILNNISLLTSHNAENFQSSIFKVLTAKAKIKQEFPGITAIQQSSQVKVRFWWGQETLDTGNAQWEARKEEGPDSRRRRVGGKSGQERARKRDRV